MNDDRIAVAGLHGQRVYRYPWEWALADGIYRTLPRCIIPFRKPWCVLAIPYTYDVSLLFTEITEVTCANAIGTAR